MLRQQLIVLRRQVKRPQLTNGDRLRLVLVARCTQFWQHALFIVQPDTLLRWHRALFRRYWRHKSRHRKRKPRVAAETVALIRKMAKENQLWGAERIRGELLKLGIRVSSRRIVHSAVTRSPADDWTAQQLREATPWGEGPNYLVCDRGYKYGPLFLSVAKGTGIKVLRTPVRAPKANAICERFIGSLRRECLDHIFIVHSHQVHRIVRAYVDYYNHSRPHQGIGQRVPAQYPWTYPPSSGPIIATPVLGGYIMPIPVPLVCTDIWVEP
jgi:putative transposase